ncbi:MAG: Ig-like domain-containing protein [Propionibacteriaceae bacterium]|nr:Ig-like domain-containing protein [Propionibacteriaceae bacterium]
MSDDYSPNRRGVAPGVKVRDMGRMFRSASTSSSGAKTRSRLVAAVAAVVVTLAGSLSAMSMASAVAPAPTVDVSASTLVVSEDWARPMGGVYAVALATVVDGAGNPMVDVPVRFSVDGGGRIDGNSVVRTDADGHAVVDVSGQVCIWLDVMVHATVEVNGQPVELAGSPAPARIYFPGVTCGPVQTLVSLESTSGGPQVVADGVDSWTAVMRLTDLQNNPLTDAASSVRAQVWYADSFHSTTDVSVSPAVELGGGRYSFALTSRTAGDYVLAYTHLDTGIYVPFSFVAGPPAPPALGSTNGAEVAGTTVPGGVVVITDGVDVPVPGCETVTADQDGRFVCRPVPALPDGSTVVLTVTDSVGNVSAPLTVTVQAPYLAVSVLELRPGDRQAVGGHNFVPGETVTGVVHSDPLELGQVQADANGDVVFDFLVPVGFEAGDHTITLTGSISGQWSGAFKVLVAASGGVLPSTGAEIGSGTVGLAVGLIGMAVIALSGSAVLAGRSSSLPTPQRACQ